MKRKQTDDSRFALVVRPKKIRIDEIMTDAGAASGGSQERRSPKQSQVDTLKQPQGFFKLPQELRDHIYLFCRQDLEYAHSGRRDVQDLTSNSWDMTYVRGPSLTPMVISRCFSDEYPDTVYRDMELVVWLSVFEGKITAPAPWFLSLPSAVKASARTVRLVVCLDPGAPHERQSYTAQDMYDCFQQLMDSTTSALPSCRSSTSYWSTKVFGVLMMYALMSSKSASTCRGFSTHDRNVAAFLPLASACLSISSFLHTR